MRSLLRRRFLWNLYAGHAVLVLVTTTAIGLVVDFRSEERTRLDNDRDLRIRAEMLASMWTDARATGSEARLQESVGDLGTRIETRLVLVDVDGIVVADSDADPAELDRIGQRTRLFEGGRTARRHVDTNGQEMFSFDLPVDERGTRIGTARASIPVARIEERIAGIRSVLFFAALVASLLGLALGFLFANHVTGPLNSMADVVESMAGGQLDRRVTVESNDEVGDLSKAFNRMAEALRERMTAVDSDRGRLSAILGSMVEGVVAVDLEARVVHLNEVAGHILSIDPGQAIGRRFEDLTGVAEIGEAIGSCLASGTSEHREARVPSRGRTRVIAIHASPLRATDGEVAGGVVVLDDVSELRRLETVRRDFLANVSHELKTPLTAIRSLVETILDDDSMTEEVRQRFLVKTRKQTERLSTLVSDLLTISRFESDEGVLARDPVDVRGPVGESARAIEAVGLEKGVGVALDLPDEPVVVDGDREGLRQIIDNLASNAVNYTPAGGRVSIRVLVGPDEVVLEVADDGIGLAPREIDRIFERFYRVDKARSRHLGGTGLGLSIVRHLALAHDGRVSVESRPGAGSTFRIHLPRSSAASPPGDESSDAL